MKESVRIATLDNMVEAQILDSILTQQNIPHAIQSFHDATDDGILQAQQGWGCISAPAHFQKKIIFLLSDLRKNASRHPGDPQEAPDAAEPAEAPETQREPS